MVFWIADILEETTVPCHPGIHPHLYPMGIETIEHITRKNWLTEAPRRDGFWPTATLVLLLMLGSAVHVLDLFQSERWMAAVPSAVFQRGEYWRLWTALFAHGDTVHLLSNLILFVPFAYFLSAYFHPLFFPGAAFILGGVINLAVITRLPANTGLVGVSGVVYWMGAAWITLSFILDRRGSLMRRILKALGVSLVLFMPQTYQPQTSYFAHFLGYVSGVLSALVYFGIAHQEFARSEKVERWVESVRTWDPETESAPGDARLPTGERSVLFTPAGQCSFSRPPMRQLRHCH